ncbi:capsular biosynthesis protein [Actibacterium ureilyticum]|uniref:capsular polysaccharide export protein, LipB/KpsS family n=1 Tax=Actibacterium ureilyticum TaxID=1590614 RepID=UPI001FE2671D|nr:capsular biosynthesis protein [Actibacterium ureilyticum]
MPMIAYLAEWTRKKDTLFASLAEAAGGGVRLRAIGLSLRGYPESDARARAALAVAKRQPRGALGKWLKYWLIRLQYNWARRYFTRHPDRIAVCWNGLTGSRRAFMAGAQDAGAARLFAELAPFPGRATLDPEGVNAQNSLPREGAFYRGWAEGQGGVDDSWRGLGANLTARASRRADVGQAGAEALADAGNFLFVPLQVPNDSQITLFAGWVQSVQGMVSALAEAAQALPDGWHIRIKEHPSARTSLADALADALERGGGRLVVDNQTDTFEQVRASGGVITINSSVGLQAFFHDRPVIVLGQAFFAIDGLVHVAPDSDSLKALLAAPETLQFDADLRADFMTFLDRTYYPRISTDPQGNVSLDPGDAQAKIAQATAVK